MLKTNLRSGIRTMSGKRYLYISIHPTPSTTIGNGFIVNISNTAVVKCTITRIIKQGSASKSGGNLTSVFFCFSCFDEWIIWHRNNKSIQLVNYLNYELRYMTRGLRRLQKLLIRSKLGSRNEWITYIRRVTSVTDGTFWCPLISRC